MADDTLAQLASERGWDAKTLTRLRGIIEASINSTATLHTLPPMSALDGETLLRPAAPPQSPPEGAHQAPLAGQTMLGRYERLGRLGEGGFSIVERVFDRTLGRSVAMKILRDQHCESPAVVARFVAEAQIMAQLRHPGIVAIHEVSRLQTGQPYFTMDEVRGQTLTAIIAQLHTGLRAGGGAAQGEWTLRRVIEIFRRLCEAVAYAHSKGITHRDLKPHNAMVGRFGQVWAVDWGLARVRDKPGDAPRPAPAPPATSAVKLNLGAMGLTPEATRMGTVAGTPGYMAPEQARGEIGEISPASDVYSLGCVLYEILTGAPPHGRGVGPIPPGAAPPIDPAAAPWAPAPLTALAMACLAQAPQARPADAGQVVELVGQWLGGMEVRDEAQALLEEAERIHREWVGLKATARAARQEADGALLRLPRGAGVEAQSGARAKKAEAEAAEARAGQRELVYVETLRKALALAPDLDEARTRLMDYRAQLGGGPAESGQRPGREGRAEGPGAPLAQLSPPTVLLRGVGTLSLTTSPPEVAIHARRLPFAGDPGQALGLIGNATGVPIPLAPGCYQLTLQAQGLASVHMPVLIRRLQRWSLTPNGRDTPTPLILPPAQALSPGERLIPPGWAMLGGDAHALGALPPERRWCPGFVLRTAAITHQEAMATLAALKKAHGAQAALALVPEHRSGAPLYELAGSGLRSRRPGILPEAVATGLSGALAEAIAAHLSLGGPAPWRILDEVQWSRLYRGPWGRLAGAPPGHPGERHHDPCGPAPFPELPPPRRALCKAASSDGYALRGPPALLNPADARLADRAPLGAHASPPEAVIFLTRPWPEEAPT